MSKLGIMTDLSKMQEPKWVTYDEEGYEDDESPVRFLIRPQTRSNLNLIEQKSKRKKAGKTGSTDDKKTEAFTRELAKFILVDWENVCDVETGQPLECTDQNKLFLFENTEIALWIIERAKGLASAKLEDDEKNSVSSSGSITALPSSESA